MFPVYKPLLPKISQILPYLSRIDENRYYTNHGPLVKELEFLLAQHFKVDSRRVVTSANGTLALMQILKALNLKGKSLCVMPSWTFIATPAAAIAAGLIPFFIDVDLNTWTITPDHIRTIIKDQEVAAVMVVSPFGAPIDTKCWEEFKEQTGIPVIIDAAASFDGFSQMQTTLPAMISLHATKALGIGEGALVIAGSAEEANDIRMWGKFGFDDGREAHVPGINAKLSEYNAAIGLAVLEEWPKKRQEWQNLTGIFENKVAHIDEVKTSPNFNKGWISSYGIIELPETIHAETISQRLKNKGIQTLAWWNKGCHKQKAYLNYPCTKLINTNYLADHTLGLPFWIGMSNTDFNFIFEKLQAALEAIE